MANKGIDIMQKKIEKIMKPHEGEKGSLIPILQAVQKECGYISEEAIAAIAKGIKLSEHEIYGVATFYAQFRFTKPGDHLIKVCVGTACHVNGGEQVMKMVEKTLNIKSGETTPDSVFSLERVACMGCCALAPVMVIDNKIYGNVASRAVDNILSQYRSPDVEE
jgi:NADH-quinone oxidoreductase subunit E